MATKYRREISTELESLDTNAFDASSDTILLDIEKTEDAAHANADKGIQILAVRKDTAVALAGTDADYIPLIVDADGRLHTSNKEHFGGAIFSKRQTSTNLRVAVGAIKLRDVVLKNNDSTNSIDIGEEHADIATMRANSFELTPGASLGFVKLNLATLFIISSGDGAAADLEVIGTEE